MKENVNEIVPADTELVPTQSQLVEEQVLALEKQVSLRARMLRAFISATKPHDWIDFQGKPYLEGEGAMRIAAVAGLGVRMISIEREPVNGDHYKYIATVEVSGGTRLPVTDEGDCASNDRFFMRNKMQPPAAEINSSDVRKKAIENARTRAVCAFLGLKGMHWEDLQGYGLGQEKAGASVTFKTPAKAPAPQSPTPKPAPAPTKDVTAQSVEFADGPTFPQEEFAPEESKEEVASQHEEAWIEILEIENAAAEKGILGKQFWEAITTYEKNGTTYKKSTQQEANAHWRDSKGKYGECRALFAWRTSARSKLQKLMGR